MSQEKDESDKVIRIFKSGNVILFFCLIETTYFTVFLFTI